MLKYLLFILCFNLYAQDFNSYDNIGLVAELVSAYKNSDLVKNTVKDFEAKFHCQCKSGISTFPFSHENLIRTHYRCHELETDKKLKLSITSEYSMYMNHYRFTLKNITTKEKK